MDSHQSVQADTFAELLDAWRGEEVKIARLITTDYVGHMLHLSIGDRTGPMYTGWIEEFRLKNPGTEFSVLDQSLAGDRLWTRLEARRADGAVANGMNVSRFVGDRIAEEWAIWSAWWSD
jgi:hypothetical protein